MSSCTTLVWPIIEEIICIYIIRDVGAIYICVYRKNESRWIYFSGAAFLVNVPNNNNVHDIAYNDVVRAECPETFCVQCVCVRLYIHCDGARGDRIEAACRARSAAGSMSFASVPGLSPPPVGRIRRNGRLPKGVFRQTLGNGWRHHWRTHPRAPNACCVDISVARAPDWRWRFLSRVYCIGTIPHLYSPTNSSEY